MDSLPETYNDPKFYMTIVSNFSWVFYKVVPREVEDNGCAFFFLSIFLEGEGGYTTWTMVSVKIVNTVKMSWV